MKNVVIFGSSGHGSVVLDCLEREKKYNVVGFIDDFKKKGSKKNGYEILGNIFDLPEVIEKFNLIGGIVAIGDNWARNLVLEKVVKIAPDFNFISAIHPNATIGKDVVIGIGTSIMPGVIINANSVVGDFCMLNTNSSLGHDGYMNDPHFRRLTQNRYRPSWLAGLLVIMYLAPLKVGTNPGGPFANIP